MSMLPPKELHMRCPRCRAAMPATERFCGTCALDREAYLAAEAVSAPAFASARRWLLALAVLAGLATIFHYWQLGELVEEQLLVESQRMLAIAPVAVLTLCYFGLWLWSRKQPLAAATVALALYVTTHLVGAIEDPSTLSEGLIFKVLIIGALIGAVRAGREAQRVRAAYARRHPTPG